MNAADPFGLVGQILDGQFRVDRLVGEGGFSVVYKGHHQGLNEPIAVKCLKLPSALGTSLVDSFVQRFRDESRILYRLSQGNLHIVRSIAAGTTQAPYTGALVPYMVLEWLDGRSLQNDLTVRRTIGNGGRSLDEVATLFSGAADALGYAHQQGVIHRDLNPGNVFLAATPRGTSAKVLDFGVAKIMHDSTLNLGPRAQTIGQIRIFAPAYGAPEQFDDRIGAVAAPSDVYSFALILLEALRDRPVNDAEHLGAFAQLAVDPSRRPTPHALGMAVPDEVEAVFARATRLDPRERWPVVGEFWQAFTSALKVATERRYRQAALATPSLPMGPVSLPAGLSIAGVGAARAEGGASADASRVEGANAANPDARASVDPKRTMPLGSPGFASLAGDGPRAPVGDGPRAPVGDGPRATPPPPNAFPLAPGTMSAVAPAGASPASVPTDPARDPRRTMMLAGGPPRMGAAPSPPESNATFVDAAAPTTEPSLPPTDAQPSVDPNAEAKRRLGSTFVMEHASTSHVHGAGVAAQAGTSQPYGAAAQAATSQLYGTPPPAQAGTSQLYGTPPPAQAAISQPYAAAASSPAFPHGSQIVPPAASSSMHAAPAYGSSGFGAPPGATDAPSPSRVPDPPPASSEISRAVRPSATPEPPTTTSSSLRGVAVAAAVLAVLVLGFAGYRFFAHRTSDTGTPSGAASSETTPSATASTPPPSSPPATAPSPDPAAVAVSASAPANTASPEPPATAKSTPSTEPPANDAPKAAPTNDAPRTPSTTDAPPKSAPSMPASSASVKTDPNAFDEAAARSRLSAANSVLVICKRAGGLSGKGNASVTFATDGTVSAVAIAPPFADTKEGNCAAGQFRRVKVRPFTGAPHTLAHTFEIPN